MTEIYYLGSEQKTADQIAAELGQPVTFGMPGTLAAGDMVFVPVRGGEHTDQLAGGNAFTGCRAFKETAGVRVFLLADADDERSPEIARFCLADACVSVGADGSVDLSAVQNTLGARKERASLDALLERLESELASSEGKAASTIQRILGSDPQETLVDQLSDGATGLFAGPFASFKLEEEFKRAMRFHHPLSLILLDIGPADEVLPIEHSDREICLAEVAAVFLAECRDIDILARFTETTFLFLLPGTGAAGAATLAERMVAELRSRSFQSRGALTPHAGVVTVPSTGIDHRGAFLARAEACLRLAAEGQGAGGLCVSCE